MLLGREDATRIVRFCLAGVGWGSALHDDELCVVKVGITGPGGTEVQRFEGTSFEEALRRAAELGVLKASCLEKQIAFLARSLPERDGTDGRSTSAKPGLDPPEGPVSEVQFPAMTAVISALVHETQRERGTSALYLSSGGRLFGTELRGQWRITDARLAGLVLFRERHAVSLPPGMARRLLRAEKRLADLDIGRAQVESLETTPTEVIERYSSANRELLSAIDDLAGGGVEPALRPTALAWMALLHAKEKTGIERAQLATVFARDRYVDGQHATVSALIASCDSYLHVFSAAAPRAADDLLREKMRSDVANTVMKMERVALSKRDGGFGIDPGTWFLTMTRKMDFLVEVESAIRASLVPSRV